MSNSFDIAVLGGGPAGLAAVNYDLFARLNVALISPDLGGAVSYPFTLRGSPAADTVWGAEVVQEFTQKASSDLTHHIHDVADRVEPLDNGAFRLHLAQGGTLQARAVIVCTGVRAQRLFVEGENEYWGRGLSYSAISQAPLFADRDIAIVGGGERAITAARILAPLAHHIYYIMARPQQMTDQENADQVLNHPKISVFRGWEVQQVLGDEFVTGIDLVGINGEVRRLPVEGIFVQFGLLPNNSAVRGLANLDRNGHIIVDEQCTTSVPGLFAAGDVTNVCAEQVIVALGEGAKAALSAWRYLAYQ
jgi:NADH-dependent peroxiredoxin subunit F